MNNTLINNTISFVKKELKNAEGGHDWFHVERVYKNSLLIANTEECNEEIVMLSALLHDVADSKFYNGDEEIGPKKAQEFLQSQGVVDKVIQHVVQIIKNISFKGGRVVRDFSSKELDVVQDADRLDAIGAIGIARAFNYGGFKNRGMYDPEIAPNLHMTKEEYKKSTAPTINHFYEKLFLLKDKMNTKTGSHIAQKRHQFMEQYVEQFYNEWDGLS